MPGTPRGTSPGNLFGTRKKTPFRKRGKGFSEISSRVGWGKPILHIKGGKSDEKTQEKGQPCGPAAKKAENSFNTDFVGDIDSDDGTDQKADDYSQHIPTPHRSVYNQFSTGNMWFTGRILNSCSQINEIFVNTARASGPDGSSSPGTGIHFSSISSSIFSYLPDKKRKKKAERRRRIIPVARKRTRRPSY